MAVMRRGHHRRGADISRSGRRPRAPSDMRLALALCLAMLHAAPSRGRARRPLPALDDDGSHESDDTILANRELTELLLPLLNNFESPRHAQRDLLHKKRLVEIMPLPQKSKQRKGPAPLFLLASELPVRTKTKLRRYSSKDSDDFDENMVEFDRSHHKKKKNHHKHKHHRRHHHKNSTSEEDSASVERKHKKKKHKNHGNSGTPSSEEHGDGNEHKHKKKKHKEQDDSNSSSEEHSDSDENNKDKKQHDSDSESSSEEKSGSDEHVEGDKSVDKKPVEDKNISNETKNDKDKNDDKTPSDNKDSKEDKNDESKNKHDESTLPEVEKHGESSKEKKDSVENKNDDTDHYVSPKSFTNESVSEEYKTPEVNRYGDIIDFSPEKQAHGTTSHIELADVVVEGRTSQSSDSSQQDGEIRYRNLSDRDEPDKSLASINEAPQDNELLESHYPNTIDNDAINGNDHSSNSADATRIAINEEYENTVLDDDVLTEAMENQDNPDISSWLNTKETVRFISTSSEEDSKVISNGDYSADNVSLNEEESNSVELAIHDSLSPESGLVDIEPEESQESDSISSEFASDRNSEVISGDLQPLWNLPVVGQPPPDPVDSFIEVLDDGDGAKYDAVPGQNYGYVYRNANKGDVSESHKTYKLSFRFNK